MSLPAHFNSENPSRIFHTAAVCGFIEHWKCNSTSYDEALSIRVQCFVLVCSWIGVANPCYFFGGERQIVSFPKYKISPILDNEDSFTFLLLLRHTMTFSSIEILPCKGISCKIRKQELQMRFCVQWFLVLLLLDHSSHLITCLRSVFFNSL